MPNIVLTRIDNRLLHGQVATQWYGSIGANLILVALYDFQTRVSIKQNAGSGNGGGEDGI